MRDCATCYVKIDIDGDKTTYCEDNYPTSVMQITQDTFELEGLMMDNVQCNLSMIWRQVPADETCCQVKSLTSEAIPSVTQFFKRSYKISSNPGS